MVFHQNDKISAISRVHVLIFFRKPIALVATLVNTFTASAVVVAITIIAFISLLLLLLSSILYVRPAFSDGLFQDQLSASMGERKVGLFIKMTPPVITRDIKKRTKTSY
jgi:hypothetical protein